MSDYPIAGEKVTSAGLKRIGMMHKDHPHAKWRGKWTICEVKSFRDKRGNVRAKMIVKGKPPLANGEKRKTDLKVSLLRRIQ